MSKIVSNDGEVRIQSHDSKWDDAISVAEEELQKLTAQSKRLQQAISIFQLNKRESVKWPTGSQGTENQQNTPVNRNLS